MSERLACVFGGTGFLGRQVVRRLADSGFRVRVLCRDPHEFLFAGVDETGLERVHTDVCDESAVAGTVAGAHAVINAISLYVEKRELSFEGIHIEGAGRVARLSRDAGVESLAHVSGIGADTTSASRLVGAKAHGEKVVAEQFPGAHIVRPSMMFGRDDAFLHNLETATRMPVVPLFCSGAETLSYREVVEAVCAQLGRRRMLLPFPMSAWKMLTRMLSLLPNPPLTTDQLYLLARDNTVNPARDGFARLGMEPHSGELLGRQPAQ